MTCARLVGVAVVLFAGLVSPSSAGTTLPSVISDFTIEDCGTPIEVLRLVASTIYKHPTTGKLHLLLDHEGYLPTFAVITEGKVHDVKVAQDLDFAPGSILTLDRGYNDYGLFGRWTEQGVYFVTRLKRGASYRVVERRPVPQHRGIVCDQVIRLTSEEARRNCPHPLRRIRYRER